VELRRARTDCRDVRITTKRQTSLQGLCSPCRGTQTIYQRALYFQNVVWFQSPNIISFPSTRMAFVVRTFMKITYHISQPIRRTVNFLLQILEKNNDECILILVIYWKKTGLLHNKISNYNIIYSSQKPRKSSLPLKSPSWLFSLSHDKDVV